MKRQRVIISLCRLWLAFSLAAYPGTAGFAAPRQAPAVAIGILSFVNETGNQAPPDLGQRLALTLQQKFLAAYPNVLPRLIASASGDANAQLTIDQMVALGKQAGVKFVIRGGLLAANTESNGEETQTTIQLYATIISVADSQITNLRAAGAGKQKTPTTNSSLFTAADLTGKDFLSSSAGMALASAIEQLAAAIYQAATRTSQDAPQTTSQQPSGGSTSFGNLNALQGPETPAVNTDAGKAADADADLQQLIAQAEQFLVSGAGSADSLQALSQALEGLKSALAKKAALFEQGKPAEAAQVDAEINTHKADLQAAVAKMMADATANNQTGNPADANPPPSTAERKNLLATINDYLGEALAIIEKIQEMRATFRSANQEMPAGLGNSPDWNSQPTNPPTTTGDPTAPNPTGNPTSPATETTESVSGVVTQQGQAVAGATITETHSGATATTATDGTYALAGVLGGKLAQLVVTKAGKQLASAALDIVAGRPNVADFQVSQSPADKPLTAIRILPAVVLLHAGQSNQTGVLKGTVQDAQGKPVARALVSLPGLALARTDANGQYLFLNVPAGAHQLTIKANDLLPKSEAVLVTAARTTVLKTQFTAGDRTHKDPIPGAILIAGAGTSLHGQVVDEQQHGIAGARVFVSQSTNALSVVTAMNGRYEIRQLKPGAYRVMVSRFGFDDAAQTVFLSAGGALQHDFQLKKNTAPLVGRLLSQPSHATGEITGQIRAASGALLANVAVELWERARGSLVNRAMTDAKGEYQLKAPAGRYEIRISQKDFQKLAHLIAVPAGGAIHQDFVLIPALSIGESHREVGNGQGNLVTGNAMVTKTAQLSGRITDLKTGATIAGATILIPGQSSAIADREGNFSFANLPAGSYRISVKRNGFTDEERTLTLRAGDRAIANFSLQARQMIFKQ